MNPKLIDLLGRGRERLIADIVATLPEMSDAELAGVLEGCKNIAGIGDDPTPLKFTNCRRSKSG